MSTNNNTERNIFEDSDFSILGIELVEYEADTSDYPDVYINVIKANYNGVELNENEIEQLNFDYTSWLDGEIRDRLY